MFSRYTQTLTKTVLLAASAFVLQGCMTRMEMFQEAANKHNVNYKTLYAICYKESKFTSNVVNVNTSIFNIQQGPHYFDNWFTANLYMDVILDPLNLNYDVGICQINEQHRERLYIDNEDLLEDETNIDVAAKIYAYNVKACNGDLKCALSMYNTGKKKSSIGYRYAQQVINIRKREFGN